MKEKFLDLLSSSVDRGACVINYAYLIPKKSYDITNGANAFNGPS